jgi:hypothetical protein
MTFDPNKKGMYPGLSWERYLSIERTRISNLKEMARSALHYRHRLTSAKKTAALELGRSAHTAVLEPERFETDYIVWDERTESGTVRPRRGKDWDAFCTANQNKTIIRADEHGFACAIRDAVRKKPVAEKYLASGGYAEVALIWDDVATGKKCKGRIDWITRIDNVDCLVGLKTTRDGDLRTFSNQAAKLLYHLQWAFYVDGYATATGREARIVEIVVESAPPHDVIVYIVPAEVIELGREEYRKLLEQLDQCERSNRWPGRADNEVLFELPAYLMRDDDEDLDELELEAPRGGDRDARARMVAALNEDL